MIYHRTPTRRIPEAQATSEDSFLNRRQLLAAMGMGGAAASALATRPSFAMPSSAKVKDLIPGELYDPAPERNEDFEAGEDRELTPEKVAST